MDYTNDGNMLPEPDDEWPVDSRANDPDNDPDVTDDSLASGAAVDSDPPVWMVPPIILINDIAALYTDPIERYKEIIAGTADSIGHAPRFQHSLIEKTLIGLGWTEKEAHKHVYDCYMTVQEKQRKAHQAQLRKEEAARQRRLKDQAAAKAERIANKKDKAGIDEYASALADLGFVFRRNLLDDSVSADGQPKDDYLEALVIEKMAELGFENADKVRRNVMIAANRNATDPVRDYLKGLVWDGQDHIRKLMTYLDDPHGPIYYADGHTESVRFVWFMRWLVGAVAKAFGTLKHTPQNPMLALDAEQGKGKSTLVKFLCPFPELHVEDDVKPDDPDHKRRLASIWIWEVKELAGTMRRAEQNALKGFLTQGTCNFRIPFARNASVKPALSSWIGTINDEGGFLTDKTGNRRFRPLNLTKIDHAYATEVDVNQVWAQAVELYRAGETADLLPEEDDMHQRLCGTYEAEDPTETWLVQYFDIDAKAPTNELVKYPFMTSVDIARALADLGMKGQTRAIQTQIGPILKQLEVTYGRQHGARGPRGYFGVAVSAAGLLAIQAQQAKGGHGCGN